MTSIEKENYDYLLGMTMWTLTKEKKDDLLRQRDEKVAELKRLQARTPVSLWKEDLDNLLTELNKVNVLFSSIYRHHSACLYFLLWKKSNFICDAIFFVVRRKGTERRKQNETYH